MPEKSLSELTRDLRMMYTRAHEAYQRDNLDYAIELFTQVLTQEPRVHEVRRLLRNAQLKKAGGGTSMFKRVFSKTGSSGLIAMGEVALRRNPIEAIAVAEKIIAGDAYSSSGHKLLAEAAIAAEMPLTALMSLEILLKNSPDDKDLGVKAAEAYSLAGETGKAEGVLARLQQKYPNDNEIFMSLKNMSAHKTMDEGGYGALASGTGSYRDVLKNKEEAVSLEQEHRQVKAEDVAERLIRDKEAKLKGEPNNLKTIRDLGDLYLEKNNLDRALEYYGKLTSMDGGNDVSLP